MACGVFKHDGCSNTPDSRAALNGVRLNSADNNEQKSVKLVDDVVLARSEVTHPRLSRDDLRLARAVLLVCAGYYLGAKVGLALTFHPHPISVLWPPNAVLLAALLVSPVRWWGWLVLGALPAHLVAELQSGVPAAMVLCWFISNVSEALIGAVFVRQLMRAALRLESAGNVAFFCCAIVIAAFLSSFLDAAFVDLIGWGHSAYWEVWKTRFIANTLASLTIVPVIVTWANSGLPTLQTMRWTRVAEGGLLFLGLAIVSIVVFDFYQAGAGVPQAFLYLPLPFLLWAALRFGPRGTSISFAIVALLVIWGAGHGRGPFIASTPAENALSVQYFLISVSIPLLFLAAVIEAQRVVEGRLRKSEERFRTAFRLSPDAMIINRTNGSSIIEVNQRWEDLFGYRRDDVIGRPVAQLNIFTGSAEGQLLEMAAMEQRDVRELSLSLRTRTGEALDTIVSAGCVEIDGEPCNITIIRDVTAQRRTEREARDQRRQLTHLTRVARLSDLSGALAHELNQPLTAILSNAQAAQRFLARDVVDLSEIRNILGDIVDADKRAGEVIRRLRALMKKGDDRFGPLDLNELIREVLNFAHSDFVTRHVNVKMNLTERLPRINGDSVQLQQLFLNLVSNACEAMEETPRSERQLIVTSFAGGHETVQVTVADRGPGIAPDEREKLFEPFFTTKERGLGLGLSICRTIAGAHNGTLRAESKSDRGAVFRIVFPAL
jgi:PAS domain S-box-containing protein